ncbi:MAG: hypothetical protein IT462_11505 [Planctomycetes bacterium]|nr:hypothetical protein [Planctomycetota bacterium]
MGYTHYWKRPKRLDIKRFKAFASDVRRLMASAPKEIEIAGWSSEGEPTFSADTLAFNGKGEQGYETFRVDRIIKDIKPFRGKYMEFCKTAQRPYDLLVCAVLIALKHHFPEVDVTSDGGASDWSAGLGLYEDVFGETPNDGPWDRT